MAEKGSSAGAQDGVATDFALSVWQKTAPAPPLSTVLGSDIHSEVVIVGGGLAGLSTALALSERGKRVTLLEAGEIGQGASGLNMGHCTPTFAHQSLAAVRQAHGGRAERLISVQTKAATKVFDIIERYVIDCGLKKTGIIQAAHAEAALPRIREAVEDYSSCGQAVRYLAADEVAALTGASGYVGGWLNEAAGHLNPLAYTRGLARAVIANGGAIHTNSQVRHIERSSDGWTAMTDHGRVACEQLVLTTGVYTGGLIPGLSRTFVRATGMGFASEPVPDEVRASFLPLDTTFTDTGLPARILGYDSAGRIVTGTVTGGSHPRDLQKVIKVALKRLYGAFPQIKGLKWPFAWRGEVDISDGEQAAIFDLGPGGHAMLGFSGRGVPTCTSFGAVLADRICGVADGELALPVRRIQPLPLGYRLKTSGMLELASLQNRLDYALSQFLP